VVGIFIGNPKGNNTLVVYLGQFDTSNYIIFQNVEIFKNYFFQIKKIL
jgi:hypothetical protein